jgi:hypothetical protein
VKQFLLSAALALFATGAYATCTPPLAVKDGTGASQNLSVGVDPSGNCLYNFGTSAAGTNPTSTLTLTSATTAYTAGQLTANNATAGSMTVPSFAIANSGGSAIISKIVLRSSDTTTTAWGRQTLQIDLWDAAPTFTNGDRAGYAVATRSAHYLGSFTCVMSPVAGDGVYSVCAPNAVNEIGPVALSSGTSIFWTLDALTGSGVTGVSQTMTARAMVKN